MTAALAKMDLTAAQGHIMGYLRRQASPPCPKDIEQEFHLSHPTVSGLLSRLEKKGFVALCPDAQDRRCKRIHILPKGQQCLQTMYETILDNESKLVKDFTPEEQAQFAALLDRAIANMGVSPCGCRKKEETKK